MHTRDKENGLHQFIDGQSAYSVMGNLLVLL